MTGFQRRRVHRQLREEAYRAWLEADGASYSDGPYARSLYRWMVLDDRDFWWDARSVRRIDAYHRSTSRWLRHKRKTGPRPPWKEAWGWL